MERTLSTRTPAGLAAVFVVIAMALTACGSDNSSVVHPPASSPMSQSPTPSPTASSSSIGPRHPKATVSPATGLHTGQIVTVSATGFSPGLSLIVVECADKGKQTGAGDCNLAASATVQTDSAGRTSAQLTVTRGPFGGNNVVCSAKLHCLISVTEASLSPTEEADTPIAFR